MEDSSCMLDTLFVLSILHIPEIDVEPPGHSPTEGPRSIAVHRKCPSLSKDKVS